MQTTTQELLRRWKAQQGHTNDSEAARALGVRPSAVNHWKQGNAHANPVSAAQMAGDLGLDTLAVLAAIEADRAQEGEARRIWQRYGKGAFMALLVLSTIQAGPTHAGERYGARNTPLCAKRKKARVPVPNGSD